MREGLCTQVLAAAATSTVQLVLVSDATSSRPLRPLDASLSSFTISSPKVTPTRTIYGRGRRRRRGAGTDARRTRGGGGEGGMAGTETEVVLEAIVRVTRAEARVATMRAGVATAMVELSRAQQELKRPSPITYLKAGGLGTVELCC